MFLFTGNTDIDFVIQIYLVWCKSEQQFIALPSNSAKIRQHQCCT